MFLSCLILQAEQLILDRKVDKEYAGIMGYEFFRKEAYKLAFGEDQNFKENCVRLSSLFCIHLI